jgi:hypothetical protein
MHAAKAWTPAQGLACMRLKPGLQRWGREGCFGTLLQYQSQ